MPAADKRQRKKENARIAREARLAAEKRRRRLHSARNAVIGAVVVIGIVFLVSFLTRHDKKNAADTTTSTTDAGVSTTTLPLSTPDFKADPKKTYTATVTTNLGQFVLALDTKNDPVGAGHFIKLARAGVYNGSRWHRVIKAFVIQGGAPKGNPSKNYGHSVVAEVPKDHYPVGALAAAKTGPDAPGTFDAQFFIVTGAKQGSSLPNDYARFGSVKSGMDVVKKIEALPVDKNQDPKTKATIDSILISES